MWKMWKMWICILEHQMYKAKENHILQYFGNILQAFSGKIMHKKYPHFFWLSFPQKNVDIVDNYFFSRFSPILTTSPAPIVINKSPLMQFSKTHF